MIIETIMTKNPITTTPETSISDAAALMKSEKVHRLPVLDRNERLIGVISEKDILLAAPSSASTLSQYEQNYLLNKLTVKKIMSRNPITISKNATVEEAATLMVDDDLSCLPVVEGEHLIGIVSKSDLFKMLLETFGAREHGTTITFLAEDKTGILNRITNVLLEKGVNLISCSVLAGTESGNRYITFKVQGCTVSTLVDIIKPFAISISDARMV